MADDKSMRHSEMSYAELQQAIAQVAATVSKVDARESYQRLKACLSVCCALASPTQQQQAAVALAHAYGRIAGEIMEYGLANLSRSCVQDCQQLHDLLPQDEAIAKNMVTCLLARAYVESVWGKTDTLAQYMDEVFAVAAAYPHSLGVQREVGVCMGSLIEICGCEKQLRDPGYAAVERMQAVAGRFPQDEELQTIYVHILVEGCKQARSGVYRKRLPALLERLQALMEEKAQLINTAAVRLRLANIGLRTDAPEQEEAVANEAGMEAGMGQPPLSQRCLDLQQSINKVAAHIPGWELEMCQQKLSNYLRGCNSLESPAERQQTAVVLAEVYGKLARWSVECGNLPSCRCCVRDCRQLHTMFAADAHLALILLQCLTGLVFLQRQQRDFSMSAEHIDEVLALATAHPRSVELQRQAAMCLADLVALCGDPNLHIDYAYAVVERMAAVADRFPDDSDLQNVYAHIIVSGCYYADRNGDAARLEHLQAKLRLLQAQKADVIDGGELRKHLARIGLS